MAELADLPGNGPYYDRILESIRSYAIEHKLTAKQLEAMFSVGLTAVDLLQDGFACCMIRGIKGEPPVLFGGMDMSVEKPQRHDFSENVIVAG